MLHMCFIMWSENVCCCLCVLTAPVCPSSSLSLRGSKQGVWLPKYSCVGRVCVCVHGGFTAAGMCDLRNKENKEEQWRLAADISQCWQVADGEVTAHDSDEFISSGIQSTCFQRPLPGFLYTTTTKSYKKVTIKRKKLHYCAVGNPENLLLPKRFLYFHYLLLVIHGSVQSL